MNEFSFDSDAFVKGLYGQMFEWLIARINAAMNDKHNANRTVAADDKYRSIGVLDIFGFEKFEHNRYNSMFFDYSRENDCRFFF